MTYRLRNIVIAVVLAAFAALLTMMYVTSYQRHVQNGEDEVSVLVAKSDIPAGTSGSDAAGMVEERMVAQRNVAPGAVSEKETLKTLVVSQPVYAGEQITRQRFSSSGEIGIRAQLKGNMRAYQLQGDQHQLLAGTLKAGDHVDLVGNIRVDPNKEIYMSRIVLRDVEVLRAAAAPTTGSRVGGAAGGDGPSVMLAVSDSQVQKLIWVTSKHVWQLELRPVTDAVDSPESVESLRSVLTDGVRRKPRMEDLTPFGGNR